MLHGLTETKVNTKNKIMMIDRLKQKEKSIACGRDRSGMTPHQIRNS